MYEIYTAPTRRVHELPPQNEKILHIFSSSWDDSVRQNWYRIVSCRANQWVVAVKIKIFNHWAGSDRYGSTATANRQDNWHFWVDARKERGSANQLEVRVLERVLLFFNLTSTFCFVAKRNDNDQVKLQPDKRHSLTCLEDVEENEINYTHHKIFVSSWRGKTKQVASEWMSKHTQGPLQKCVGISRKIYF